MEIIVADPSDQPLIEIDWTDVLGDTLDLVGDVSHGVPSPLTLINEITDAPNKRSFVQVSGMVHGQCYAFEAQAILSNGEVINRNFPVRCFNG